jgi:hypothetical protein
MNQSMINSGNSHVYVNVNSSAFTYTLLCCLHAAGTINADQFEMMVNQLRDITKTEAPQATTQNRGNSSTPVVFFKDRPIHQARVPISTSGSPLGAVSIVSRNNRIVNMGAR